MSEILKYTLVDENDVEADYEFDSYQEAVNAAGNTDAVICRTYTFHDSELVYTPDGSGVWPPEKCLCSPEWKKANSDHYKGCPREEL